MAENSNSRATGQRLKRTIGIAYGALTIGVGVAMGAAFGGGLLHAPIYVLPVAVAVYDGGRRIYNQTLGHGKGVSFKSTGRHISDILLATGVLVAGGLTALWSGIGCLAICMPILIVASIVGGIVAVGAAGALIKSVRSFVKERVRVSILSDEQVKTSTPAPVASKEVAPAFTVASEVKADNAPEKPATPVPPAPTA